MGPHERGFRGDDWNLHALDSVYGGLPFVDLDGLLDLSPVIVVLPSWYSKIVHFYPLVNLDFGGTIFFLP